MRGAPFILRWNQYSGSETLEQGVNTGKGRKGEELEETGGKYETKLRKKAVNALAIILQIIWKKGIDKENAA